MAAPITNITIDTIAPGTYKFCFVPETASRDTECWIVPLSAIGNAQHPDLNILNNYIIEHTITAPPELGDMGILIAPDGSKWIVTVDENGILTTTKYVGGE